MTTPHRRAQPPHECERRLIDLADQPSDRAWTGKRIGVRYARHPGGPTAGTSRRAGCRSCSSRRSPGGVCPRRTIPGRVRRFRSVGQAGMWVHANETTARDEMRASSTASLALLLICAGPWRQRRGACGERGGSWAWWSGRVWCVRAPGLISVRDPGFGVGDVMVDGVVPRGDAVRPLGLWRPSACGRRQQ